MAVFPYAWGVEVGVAGGSVPGGMGVAETGGDVAVGGVVGGAVAGGDVGVDAGVAADVPPAGVAVAGGVGAAAGAVVAVGEAAAVGVAIAGATAGAALVGTGRGVTWPGGTLRSTLSIRGGGVTTSRRGPAMSLRLATTR